jgi:hypothetical protein
LQLVAEALAAARADLAAVSGGGTAARDARVGDPDKDSRYFHRRAQAEVCLEPPRARRHGARGRSRPMLALARGRSCREPVLTSSLISLTD